MQLHELEFIAEQHNKTVATVTSRRNLLPPLENPRSTMSSVTITM